MCVCIGFVFAIGCNNTHCRCKFSWAQGARWWTSRTTAWVPNWTHVRISRYYNTQACLGCTLRCCVLSTSRQPMFKTTRAIHLVKLYPHPPPRPRTTGRTALMWALASKHFQLVPVLIAAGAEPDEVPPPPFHFLLSSVTELPSRCDHTLHM